MKNLKKQKILTPADPITPFLVMEIMEKSRILEKKGESIVHLEVGEPDFSTPRIITQAGVRALQEGKTHYTHSLGIPRLREAIARKYRRDYGVIIDPECILVTGGTSPALLLALSVLICPGDQVMLSDPHYSCYPNFIRYLRGEPQTYPLDEDDGYQPHYRDITRHLKRKTRAVLINSPANPTGAIISRKNLEEIAHLDRWIVSDEIYHGLVYRGRAHSILEFTDRAFVINGFSKLYAMTGWRLGYLIFPPDFRRKLQSLHQNLFISANAFVQWGGIAALEKTRGEVSKMVREFDRRRNLLVDGLREIGFGIKVPPDGAFYIFANARKFGRDSLKMAFEILENAGVAVAPGVDFGSRGEGFIRFAYTTSQSQIREGIRRLGKYLHGRG